VLEVKVNGESKSISGSTSISQLIRDMDLLDKRIAVEVNGEIIPSSQHSTHLLKQHDNIEIVGAIGGG
jgi:sulfur carrier protein